MAKLMSARPLYSRSLSSWEKRKRETKHNHKMQPEKQKQSIIKAKKQTNCKQKWNNSAGLSCALFGRVHFLAHFWSLCFPCFYFSGAGKKLHFWARVFSFIVFCESETRAKTKRPVRLYPAPEKKQRKKCDFWPGAGKKRPKVRPVTRHQKRPLSSTNPTRPPQTALCVLLVLFFWLLVFAFILLSWLLFVLLVLFWFLLFFQFDDF